MLLKGCLRFMLFVVCSAALAGCGGLRRLPLTANDGGPTGIGGSSAGAGGNSAGGAGGSTGGSINNNDGGLNDAVFIDSGNVDVPVSNCVAGGACVPANPCRKGMFVCNEGAMSCMELTAMQANGTVCDVDKVCHNGSCDACVADMACDVTGKPCRVGTIVCTTGAPVCTESDNKPNGTSCGTGMVCQVGACATCQMGGACTPANKCHTGTLVCSGAAPTCTDTNTNVPAGTTCGTDMVCNAGSCAACVAGMSCVVPGKPCTRGTIACNTGTPACIESGNAPNGTVCGTDMVCNAGTCAACSAGAICQPSNPCHAGAMVCAPTIGCADTNNALANGTMCGLDKVCNAGTCVGCASGASCQPTTNPCKKGVTTCTTGSPVCGETGNQPDGTMCGANMVCMTGSCMACAAGGACTPTASPCHKGTLSCTTGSPVCTDNGMSQTDGTACGANLVCKTGSCVSCTANQACQPTNPCKNGATACTTGSMVCAETTNKGVGTLCGAGQSCANGVLTLPAMCNAAGACAAMTTPCTNGCNTSGTDCANCPAGQTSCPAGCKDLTRDALNCSQCGSACPVPQVGTGIAVCVNSTCDISCNAGYLQCLPLAGQSIAMCQQAGWDFENMTPGGFKISNSPTAAVKIGYHGGVSHTGMYTLGIQIAAMGVAAPARVYQVGQSMCIGRGFVKAKTVTAWMMLTPDDKAYTFGSKSYFGIRIYTERGEAVGTGSPRGYNEWFPVSVPVDSVGAQLQAIAIEGFFEPGLSAGPPPPWLGFVYVDDIVIE